MPLENLYPEWQITERQALLKPPRLLIYRKLLIRTKALDHDLGARRKHLMLDLIMIAIALGFFALSVGYTIACDRL